MTAPEAPAERKAKYRCPYCKAALDEPNGKCPACGKWSYQKKVLSKEEEV